jgi:3'(2'), 5'-bisphosphate nucleotidase
MDANEEMLGHLEAVLSIAEEAGRRILAIYDGPSFDVTVKGDGSPLTAADRAAHDLIVTRLAALTPAMPVLSEESTDLPSSVRSAWTRFWLVDPLDGTKEFIKRNGEFTVNIALIDSGRPVLGVVYVPVTRVAYLALRGHGAWKQQDGRRQPIRARAYSGGKATVVASRSHSGPEVDRFLARLRSSEGDYETTSMGSSLKLCLVAEGAADIYPRLGPTSEWDTAAAHCIVDAAGGSVTGVDGVSLRYNKTDILNPWFLTAGDTTYAWRAFLDDGDPAS